MFAFNFYDEIYFVLFLIKFLIYDTRREMQASTFQILKLFEILNEANKSTESSLCIQRSFLDAHHRADDEVFCFEK